MAKSIKDYLPDIDPTKTDQYQEELEAVSQLPQKDLPAALSDVANILLGVTGSIAIIGLIVAGVLYITAKGDEQQMDKAKGILLYIVIGLAVIAASYAIILGVSSLSFE